jgi:hypothetical protein
LFGWKVRLLTRFSVACGPDGTRRSDPESIRVVQLQTAAACDRNRQAHGSTPPHPGARHGHAKEVADTLDQRYGSGGRGVKPARWSAIPTHKGSILGPRSSCASRHAERSLPSLPFWLSAAPRVVRFRFSRFPPQCALRRLAQGVDNRVENVHVGGGEMTGWTPVRAADEVGYPVGPGNRAVRDRVKQ